MEGLNQVTLIGNLGMEPELKFTQGGDAVLRMRLATTKKWLDKTGKRQEHTEWHTVIVWGKRAEGLNKVLSKGSGIYVVGELNTRSWDDKDGGGKRYATEIRAHTIGFTGSGPKSGERAEGRDAGRASGERERGGAGQGSGYGASTGQGDFGYGPGATDDDDIPFGPIGDVG